MGCRSASWDSALLGIGRSSAALPELQISSYGIRRSWCGSRQGKRSIEPSWVGCLYNLVLNAFVFHEETRPQSSQEVPLKTPRPILNSSPLKPATAKIKIRPLGSKQASTFPQVTTNKVKVAPIKTKNPAKAHATHIFSNVAMILLPMPTSTRVASRSLTAEVAVRPPTQGCTNFG